MEKILVRVSGAFSRPWLKPGKYVSVDICKQFDFSDREITEQTPFRSSFSFGPIALTDLRSYLLGMQHMSKFRAKESEFIFEVPMELHALLLGVDDLKDATTPIAA